MNLKTRLMLATLASGILGTAARAEVQLPQIQVSAQAIGSPFKNMVIEDEVPNLLRSVVDRFVDAASKVHPCVEWKVGDVKENQGRPTAHLVLLFQRVPYYNSFRIQISYKAQNSPSSGLTFNVITPVEETVLPIGYARVSKILTERTGEELEGDELQTYITAEFIRRMPITSAVQIDEEGQRIVVPVNAKRLRLAADSPVFVDIKGQPFCSTRPEDCEVRLLSLGPSYVKPFDLLWCRPEDSDCCRPLPWSVARKLQEVKDKQVFLGEDHRHCPSFQGCRFKGLSWDLGPSQKGGSR